MGNLILISCSDKKKEGGGAYPAGSDPVPWLKDQSLRQRLFDTRSKVYELIKENRLVDAEKSQGDRGLDPRNASLALGPDFGGKAEGSYLPACVRYDGRFFRTIRGQSSEDEVIGKWRGLRKGYCVLIVSGLYGLVAPFDPIQEYTCHFADRIAGQDTSLQMLWRELLTEIVRDQAAEATSVLIDLLSEEAYEDAFDWHSIYKSTKCLHRAYKLKAGPETLINSALFFDDHFIMGQGPDLSLCPDRFISKDYFDRPDEQILFESELKTTKKEVAREGIQKVQPELKRRYGLTWDSLSDAIRNQIANSEYSYARNRDLPGFDFTSASICLSKAVEIWLEKSIVEPLTSLPKLRTLLKNAKGSAISPYEATIGNVSYFLKSVKKAMSGGWIGYHVSKTFPAVRSLDFEELSAELEVIASDYRNGWAHKKPMPRTVYEEFRVKACEFFKKWVPRWKAEKAVP